LLRFNSGKRISSPEGARDLYLKFSLFLTAKIFLQNR